jgi:hypothetical protein
MDEKFNDIKQDLILLLIWLTGWEEDKRNSPGEKVFRAWKGYKFEILNDLQTQQLIYQIPGGKSLILTNEGKQKVELLKRKYLAAPRSMNPAPAQGL